MGGQSSQWQWKHAPIYGGCSHQNLHSTYSGRDLPAMLDETDMGNGKPAIIHMNDFFFRWVAYWTLHVANFWECKPTPSWHSISQCGTWGWQCREGGGPKDTTPEYVLAIAVHMKNMAAGQNPGVYIWQNIKKLANACSSSTNMEHILIGPSPFQQCQLRNPWHDNPTNTLQ